MRDVPQELIVRTSYADLCKSPQGIIETIQKRYQSAYDTNLISASSPPDSFDVKSRVISNDDEVAVVEALRKIGLDN